MLQRAIFYIRLVVITWMIGVMIRVCIAVPGVLIVFPVFPVIVSVAFIEVPVRARTNADKDYSCQAKKG